MLYSIIYSEASASKRLQAVTNIRQQDHAKHVMANMTSQMDSVFQKLLNLTHAVCHGRAMQTEVAQFLAAITNMIMDALFAKMDLDFSLMAHAKTVRLMGALDTLPMVHAKLAKDHSILNYQDGVFHMGV